jgi:hypothetical protein
VLHCGRNHVADRIHSHSTGNVAKGHLAHEGAVLTKHPAWHVRQLFKSATSPPAAARLVCSGHYIGKFNCPSPEPPTGPPMVLGALLPSTQITLMQLLITRTCHGQGGLVWAQAHAARILQPRCVQHPHKVSRCTPIRVRQSAGSNVPETYLKPQNLNCWNI